VSNQRLLIYSQVPQEEAQDVYRSSEKTNHHSGHMAERATGVESEQCVRHRGANVESVRVVHYPDPPVRFPFCDCLLSKEEANIQHLGKTRIE